MDLNKWIETNINKKNKTILLIVYGLLMFITIYNEINTVVFILLFVVAPISIYFIVKKIFPKNSDHKKEI